MKYQLSIRGVVCCIINNLTHLSEVATCLKPNITGYETSTYIPGSLSLCSTPPTFDHTESLFLFQSQSLHVCSRDLAALLLYIHRNHDHFLHTGYDVTSLFLLRRIPWAKSVHTADEYASNLNDIIFVWLQTLMILHTAPFLLYSNPLYIMYWSLDGRKGMLRIKNGSK